MLETINSHYNELMLLMVSICIVGIAIMIIPLILTKKKKTEEKLTKVELTDQEIKTLDETLDKEKLIKETFSLYKKMEVAKTKFKYDILKELLTPSLYEEEEQKLQELKANKQKLVATNIKFEDAKILSLKKEDTFEIIDIHLHVSQYDYIIDSKKKIIRGTDDAEYQIEYKITLEKHKDKYFIKKIETLGKWIKN